MANEKMIMGVPPDDDSNSGKKGGSITKIIIIICVLFAVGFLYFKNNSDAVKEKNQSQKIVQQVPKQTIAARTQEIEVASPFSIDTSKQPDNLNINAENNEQIHIKEQESSTHSVVVAQEDHMEDSSTPDQSISLNTSSSPNLSETNPSEAKSPVEIQAQPPLKKDSTKSEAPAVTMQQDDNAFEQPMNELLVENNVHASLATKNISDESEPIVEILANQTNKDVSKKENISQKDLKKRDVISQPSKAETIWTVKAGEYLWLISKDTKTFGDPQKWKAIYEANKDQIVDANLIYPGQRLIIPN